MRWLRRAFRCGAGRSVMSDLFPITREDMAREAERELTCGSASIPEWSVISCMKAYQAERQIAISGGDGLRCSARGSGDARVTLLRAIAFTGIAWAVAFLWTWILVQAFAERGM